MRPITPPSMPRSTARSPPETRRRSSRSTATRRYGAATARPWHAGILWDADPRLAEPLIAALRADPDLVVGDNEPYSGTLANDSMYRHATRRGLAHGLLEIRQDLIGDGAGAEAWAERLAPIFADLNRRPGVHDIHRYGSRTGPVDPI